MPPQRQPVDRLGSSHATAKA